MSGRIKTLHLQLVIKLIQCLPMTWFKTCALKLLPPSSQNTILMSGMQRLSCAAPPKTKPAALLDGWTLHRCIHTGAAARRVEWPWPQVADVISLRERVQKSTCESGDYVRPQTQMQSCAYWNECKGTGKITYPDSLRLLFRDLCEMSITACGISIYSSRPVTKVEYRRRWWRDSV